MELEGKSQIKLESRSVFYFYSRRVNLRRLLLSRKLLFSSHIAVFSLNTRFSRLNYTFDSTHPPVASLQSRASYLNIYNLKMNSCEWKSAICIGKNARNACLDRYDEKFISLFRKLQQLRGTSDNILLKVQLSEISERFRNQSARTY